MIRLLFWAAKGTTIMRPKSKGSGIMVSDFVSERDGYLALTENEYQRAKRVDPSIQMYTRQLKKTSEKFMCQIKQAVKIAEAKYPREGGLRIV